MNITRGEDDKMSKELIIDEMKKAVYSPYSNYMVATTSCIYGFIYKLSEEISKQKTKRAHHNQ